LNSIPCQNVQGILPDFSQKDEKKGSQYAQI